MLYRRWNIDEFWRSGITKNGEEIYENTRQRQLCANELSKIPRSPQARGQGGRGRGGGPSIHHRRVIDQRRPESRPLFFILEYRINPGGRKLRNYLSREGGRGFFIDVSKRGWKISFDSNRSFIDPPWNRERKTDRERKNLSAN